MRLKLRLGIDILAVIVVTIYLIVYCALLQFENTPKYSMLMFLFSPVMIIGMVYIVLKYGKYDGPGLGNDEFGYQDKNKDDLGTF